MNIESINNWLPAQENGIPLIAGPCSAESEEQVMATAQAIFDTGLKPVFRAGVWKPRTQPGGFEGHGYKALEWLKKVKEKFGFKIAIEIANANHAKLAIENGVDILWIGARTTVNPFSVQEIADAIKGHDIPVMVKNPINPDLKLWEGALKRIAGAGITKIAAIHRGFSSFQTSSFRNKPMWELAIELQRLHPSLPIICDPSHICGKRDLLGFISQQAIDLGMQGLMIETHINPDAAWTDADQQVSPKGLVNLIAELKPKQADNHSLEGELEGFRNQIDQLDKDIILHLADRMKLVEKIGEYKKENDVTILQVNRWDDIIKGRLSLGASLNLNEKFVRKILDVIHGESIAIQTEIMNNEPVSK